MKNKDREPAIVLSYAQIWVGITVIASLFGTIFYAGIKVESEVSKVALLKQEQTFQKMIAERENTIIEFNRKLKEADEDKLFFKDRYTITNTRLQECLKKEPYTKFSILSMEKDN
jgi:ADP-glucose pyrophosphorylase